MKVNNKSYINLSNLLNINKKNKAESKEETKSNASSSSEDKTDYVIDSKDNDLQGLYSNALSSLKEVGKRGTTPSLDEIKKMIFENFI